MTTLQWRKPELYSVDELITLVETVRKVPITRVVVSAHAVPWSVSEVEPYWDRVRRCKVTLLVLGRDVWNQIRSEYLTELDVEVGRDTWKIAGVLVEFSPSNWRP